MRLNSLQLLAVRYLATEASGTSRVKLSFATPVNELGVIVGGLFASQTIEYRPEQFVNASASMTSTSLWSRTPSRPKQLKNKPVGTLIIFSGISTIPLNLVQAMELLVPVAR